MRAVRAGGILTFLTTLMFWGMGLAPAASTAAWGGGSTSHLCARSNVFCAEVASPYEKAAFGNKIVGHDEPSILFYSDKVGSGYRQHYTLRLPKDPPPTPITGRSYTFELTPAFWFGLAMCADQSAPDPGKTCKPDSDSNIVSNLNHAPGAAYMEMQFYPPGWVPFQEAGGISCSSTQWCAALNIDSYSENMSTGQTLNQSCAKAVGVENVNFAFITKTGVPQGPPNPVQATLADTYTPDATKDLMMNPNDLLSVNIFDTTNGLEIAIKDLTTHGVGKMVASGRNGFGQVRFAPDPSTVCANVPYNFHPMFATSSPRTRVAWAAHSYNVAYDPETGHFDWCQGSPSGASIQPGGACPSDAFEGPQTLSWSDYDDLDCADGTWSLRVQVSGCVGANYGFDGAAYLRDWPDGNTKLHPTPIKVSSPTFGATFTDQYSRIGFEVDTPRVEGTYCLRQSSGRGCTLVPLTDDGTPAAFYPFFSTVKEGTAGCFWAAGNKLPGGNDFGGVKQYGKIFALPYPLNGAIQYRYNDYRSILSSNPCPAKL
ncbi:MAG TPA: hypothetical protein VFB34_07815 [Chloroflexota bacterium]|nr:hypothetical protein [Chloroflexota bacterium]